MQISLHKSQFIVLLLCDLSAYAVLHSLEEKVKCLVLFTVASGMNRAYLEVKVI